MKSKFLSIIICSFLLTALSSSVDAEKVDFVTQIKPLLEKHCMECHNADGDSFPIEVKDDAFSHIVEGEPEESEIYLVLVSDDEDEHMPPADFERPLTDDQKELIKTWIAEGAEWPEDTEFVMWKPDDASSDDTTASGVAETDNPQNENPEEASEIDPRIFKAVGSLHPAILHLPMGLLLAAGLFAFLSLRGNFVMGDCAYYCLWLGVLCGILACVSGWFFSETTGNGTVTEFKDIFDDSHKVYWHRLSALLSTIFGLLVALFAMSARAKDPDEGSSWKLGTIILAAGIGYVGMTGGKLVYPSNHYKDLNALWNETIENLTKEEPAVVDPVDGESADVESTDGEATEVESADSEDAEVENTDSEAADENMSDENMSDDKTESSI